MEPSLRSGFIFFTNNNFYTADGLARAQQHYLMFPCHSCLRTPLSVYVLELSLSHAEAALLCSPGPNAVDSTHLVCCLSFSEELTVGKKCLELRPSGAKSLGQSSCDRVSLTGIVLFCLFCVLSVVRFVRVYL